VLGGAEREPRRGPGAIPAPIGLGRPPDLRIIVSKKAPTIHTAKTNSVL